MTSHQANESAASVVHCMRRLFAEGLTTGTTGNASLRSGDGMLITPTGIHPAEMTPEAVVTMDLAGHPRPGPYAPSSEWPMHAAIYRARTDVGAIVHCHSRCATALACSRRDIPAFHYMVAMAGGDSIRCAPYATFGSSELGQLVVDSLRERRACLMANHGQICVGADLEDALDLARKVEELAALYQACLAIGDPALLGDAEMREVLEKIRNYGQPKRSLT